MYKLYKKFHKSYKNIEIQQNDEKIENKKITK